MGKKVREQTGTDQSPLLPGARCSACGGEPTAVANARRDCSSTVAMENVWLTLVSYPFL